jgi:hypothetical protein
MNAFSANWRGNLICNSQTFGKKENVSQECPYAVHHWLSSRRREVKLPRPRRCGVPVSKIRQYAAVTMSAFTTGFHNVYDSLMTHPLITRLMLEDGWTKR